MIQTTPDVNTIELNLPTSISAYVISNADTSYTIVLNSKLTWERRFQAYLHELEHIKSGDYERQSADLIELHAHQNIY